MKANQKLTSYAVTAFLVYLTITNPTEAAEIVRTVASGIGTFANALTGGGGQ